MRFIQGKKGMGKTTRLLYASEFRNIPIICVDAQHKKELLHKAVELQLIIPEPITLNEIINKSKVIEHIDGVLIDNLSPIIRALFSNLGVKAPIKGVTLDLIEIEEQVDEEK